MLPNSFHNVQSDATVTIDGDGATLVTPAVPANRAAIEVTNDDELYDVGLKRQKSSATAPTLTSLAGLIVLPPQETVILPYAESIAVYAINSSGGATTSTVTVVELA